MPTVTLPRRRLGRTGLEVSLLGFGAAPIGYLETDQQRASALLNHLLDQGLNLIDTAAAYAGSEEAIGKAVGHRREEFVLVSKCGRAGSDLPGEDWSSRLVMATVDRALQRLKTDRLDVMLLHSCDLATLQKGDALEGLVQARDSGKIRFAGYSGDNDAAAFAAAHPVISVIETSISLVDQANVAEVLPVAQKHDVGVLTKRSIGNAAWKPLSDQPGFYREYAREYHDRFASMALNINELGLDRGATDWAEAALRFALSQPGVSSALIGTTNLDNALRNIEIARKPPLPNEAMERIRSAFHTAEQKSGIHWRALT